MITSEVQCASYESLERVLKSEPQLAEAVQWVSEQLRAGAGLDQDELRAKWPAQVEKLGQLLPTIELLVRMNPPDPNAEADVTPLDGQLPNRTLGDFRICREIGRGGMGVVYEAEQLSLGRRVAIKVLPFASLMDPRRLERFKNEARAAATLKHPNIVSVHSVGCERGVHFYAMELVDGQTLADVVADIDAMESGAASCEYGERTAADSDRDRSVETRTQAHLSTAFATNRLQYFQSVARIGIAAAEALHFAHQEGVIHRDVKPSNLMLDRHGKLWVTDFGLAHIHNDSDLTLSGDVLGTARYMSPEPAGGKGYLDERTDIYSLGVTLYELLTGKRAFPGEGKCTLDAVIEKQPVVPRKLQPRIPPNLETIVVKAIAKRPEARYSTAQELADDLQRFLDCKPIKARKVTRVEHVRWWARRNRTIAILSSSLLVLLAVLATGGVSSALRMAHVANETKQRLYVSDMTRVKSLIDRGEILRAVQVLESHVPETGEDDPRGFEWFYLRSQCQRFAAKFTLGHTVSCWAADFSPDGRLLATVGFTKAINLWDVQSGKKVQVLSANKTSVRHLGQIRDVAFTRKGDQLLSASEDGTVFIWDAQSGEYVTSLEDTTGRYWATNLAVGTGGEQIAVGYLDVSPGRGSTSTSHVCIWDLRSREIAHRIDDVPGRIRGLDFSPDGRWLAAGSSNGTARIWNAQTWEPERDLAAHSSDVHCVSFSPNSRQLVTTGGIEHATFVQGEFCVWNAGSWSEAQRRTIHQGVIRAADFSLDGQTLIVGSDDHAISVWDLDEWRCVKTFRAHGGIVFDVTFSPDGRLFCSASEDNTARLFDLEQLLSERKTDLRFGARPHVYHWRTLLAESGTAAVSITNDGFVSKWDTLTGERLYWRQAIDAEDGLYDLAVSHNDGLMAVGVRAKQSDYTLNGEVQIYGFAIGDLRHRISLEGGFRHGLAFAPDDRQLAIGASDRIVIFSPDTNRKIGEIPLNEYVKWITYSPDGETLAACTNGGRSYFFDVTDLTLLNQLETEDGWGTMSIAYSPDGDEFVTVGGDRLVKIWDASTYKLIRKFAGSPDWITHVSFSRDGRRILTANKDGFIRIWHREVGEPVLTLHASSHWMMNGEFAENNRMVVAGGDEIRVWRAFDQFDPLPVYRPPNQPCDEAFELSGVATGTKQ